MKDKQTLNKEIEKFKKEKNAVILAHNYQYMEVQEIADYVGDSLGLSIEASKTDADIIVFCGVYFMAESAKILSPNKKVLIPRKDAGCSMADMINRETLQELKKKYPNSAVVSYVNTNADVKAESDICCTSANATKVCQSLPQKRIIFVPDRNLGRNVAKEVSGKEFIYFDGCCPTHELLREEDIKLAKERYPNAEVIVHPECRPEVVELADASLSTSMMVNYAINSPAQEFIVGTERGMISVLKKKVPNKVFHLASDSLVCPTMKFTKLIDVYESLKHEQHEVNVEEGLRELAHVALNKMISL